jgi:membrane protease YdiL (CAAX protease family)
MSAPPESDPLDPYESNSQEEADSYEPESRDEWPPKESIIMVPLSDALSSFPQSSELPTPDGPPGELQLVHSWDEPVIHRPPRIPNLGHLGILAILTVFGWIGAGLLGLAALHFHLFGIASVEKAMTDVHYTLGSMIVLYVITFCASLVVFPLLWDKSFFDGIQWNGTAALHLRFRLFGAAFVCFIFALLNGWLMPGPDNTPIDQIFRAPGAAWLLFVFGITAAPFFEELLFRGFLLPALCTAFDWTTEKITHQPAAPLNADGHPQWSMVSMAVASILTSIPFALMHAEQTGYSLGPFVLLVCVSLVLCWARLSTRSLAASVFVHASYNCLLFCMMLLGTEGFRHLDKM